MRDRCTGLLTRPFVQCYGKVVSWRAALLHFKGSFLVRQVHPLLTQQRQMEFNLPNVPDLIFFLPPICRCPAVAAAADPAQSIQPYNVIHNSR